MAVRCELCGQESELEHAYSKLRRSFSLRVRTVCPSCISQKSGKQSLRTLWLYVGLCLLGATVLQFNPDSRLGWLCLNLFILSVFEIFAVIPHELGHAIVGRRLGFRVFSIVIGSGKLIYEKVLIGFRWYFRVIPLSGVVWALPRDYRNYRTKMVLFVLAGPMVNLLLAAAIFPWVEFRGAWWLPDDGMITISAAIFATNAFGFFSALLPYSFTSGAGVLNTDGLQLFNLLFRPKKNSLKHRALYYLMAGEECRKSKQYEEALAWYEKGLNEIPDHEYLLNGKAVLLLDLRRFTEARQLLLVVFRKADLDNGMRCLVLNNLAYADVLLNDQQLLPEAEEYSAEAYKQAPWLTAFKHTRGMVLVETGRLEEGVSLLTDSLKESDFAEHKAENAAFLAIAEHRLGNQKKAREYLKLVQKLDPQCFLLERARLAIGE